MTKNQINYLLVLLTLFVFWFYFNTFYVDMRREQRSNSFGLRRPARMMTVRPNSMLRSNAQSMSSKMPATSTSVASELQRMKTNFENDKAAKALSQESPADVKQENK